MAKDLTSSHVERQNILNNQYALQEIRKATKIECIQHKGDYYVTKDLVARFFEVDVRTIERYIEKNQDEFARNGYRILRGKSLSEFKLDVKREQQPDINVGQKAKNLGVFNFRAFLNMAMLLVESERARLLRQAILDIVIDTINQRTGGGTKYINQRDEDFLHSWFEEDNYRRQFTDALKDCVDMGNFKYPMYTDKIYVGIFKEKAEAYRKVLKLHEKDKVRDTFYSEILDLVASFECGFGAMLQNKSKQEGRKLTSFEADLLFHEFESLPHWRPLIEKARNKMASRDLAFRDALHQQLKEYVTPLQAEEFERFLGEKSKELVGRLEEAKDVMKRLKERE